MIKDEYSALELPFLKDEVIAIKPLYIVALISLVNIYKYKLYVCYKKYFILSLFSVKEFIITKHISLYPL